VILAISGRYAMTAEKQAGIRVVRGAPDDEELAALLAVLLSVTDTGTAAVPGDGERPKPGWTRNPPYRSPGAWAPASVVRPLVPRVEE
jgi:hypothetical protein